MRDRSRRLACTLGFATSIVLATATFAASDPPRRTDVLDRPMHGNAAIQALEANLPEVAAQNRQTAEELVRLLRTDPTMWLDRTGQLHVKETHLPASPAPSGTSQQAPFPEDQTFKLHSKAGAPRVVHLDFDGHAVTGTSWNAGYGVSTSPQPAFDLNGSPSVWSQSEHDAIQSVYQRVAEDFAPFNVDVTTEDPGDAALQRTGSSDESYGTRVLITPSAEAHDKMCGGCGGIAYVGIFNSVDNSYYHPAWVFPQMLGNNSKNIAEAASHEAGHNLGLWHDGTPTAGYYTGHRNWAPIMGVGYYEPLSQWSRGEYSDANNTEDDFAVMQNYGLPLRDDDHGSSTGNARALGSATNASGTIETRTDQDVFSISRTCSGNTTIGLATAPVSPNLDGKLRLLNASGAVVAQDDPLSGESTSDIATGLSASVTANLAVGTYYIEVDGVGAVDTVSGYSDYGSLGKYNLNISACAPTGSTYEESDPTVSWKGWRGATDPTANGGTYRWSNKYGDFATFKFSGSAVTWLTRKGPSQGIGKVYIDGVLKGTVDLYSATTANFSKAYTGLASTTHTIKVLVTNTKNAASSGYNVALDGLQVGSTVTQDGSGKVGYDYWTGGNSVNASGGAYRTTASANQDASLTFTGTSVDWITAMGPTAGKAQVLIDGVDKGVVDLYRSTQAWKVTKTYSGLTSGAHTIVIKALGTKNASATGSKVVVDGFTVRR